MLWQPRAAQVRTSVLNLAFGALNQSTSGSRDPNLKILTSFFLLPEPAVIVSSSLTGEKQQPCLPEAAGICGSALPGLLRLPAWQPPTLSGAPTPRSSPCSPAKPASPVYVCCPHFCCCIGLHQLHCSSLLPAGLLKACCSLYHPP